MNIEVVQRLHTLIDCYKGKIMKNISSYPSVLYINEDKVESILMEDVASYLRYIQNRIASIASNDSTACIKPKVIYDDPVHPESGDIRSMTCFTDRVKVMKIISTNPIRKKHWSVSVGATLLLDYEENHPIAIFDATNMSAIRTSAMAVLGAVFADSDLNDTLIIGYGRVGSCAAKFVKELGGNVRIYDSKLKFTDQKVEDMEFIDELDRFEASTIITATTSREAFLSTENTKADFIVSVGADTAFNFELSSELIKDRGGLFVDCPDAAYVGDLSKIEKVDSLINGDVLDLYNLKDQAKTLVSVGSPLMDALTVEYMAKKIGLL